MFYLRGIARQQPSAVQRPDARPIGRANKYEKAKRANKYEKEGQAGMAVQRPDARPTGRANKKASPVHLGEAFSLRRIAPHCCDLCACRHGLVNQLLECFSIVDSHIGQKFAVQFDASLVKAVDEPTIL